MTLSQTFLNSLILVSLTSLLHVSCTAPTQTPVTATQDFSMSYGTTQTYAGSVASRSAVFELKWQSDGNVQGQYSHPQDGTGMVYSLKGSNTKNGELVLTEYTAGRQSAILTLKKSIAGDVITWSGKMHNTDGRVLPVSFSRRAPKGGDIDECCMVGESDGSRI